MSNLDGYRANLREAQGLLEIAQTVKDEFKARGQIEWGTTKRGFSGWLVKTTSADDAYTAWAKARSDV